MNIRWWWLLPAFLSACSAPVRERHGLPPVEERGPGVSPTARPAGSGFPGGEEPAATAAVPAGTLPVIGSGAVRALARRSDAALAAGDTVRAGDLLERALRIEPENPWLWHRLARVRLQEGRRAEARELARKSLSLSGGSRRLRILNQRLIRTAGGGEG